MPLSALLFFDIVNIKIVSLYQYVKRRDYMDKGKDKDKEQILSVQQQEDTALKTAIPFFRR